MKDPAKTIQVKGHLEYIEDFKTHLFSTGYSRVTVKNYLSDLKKFLQWKGNEPFSVSDIDNYRNFLARNGVARSTEKRIITTVIKFGKSINSKPLASGLYQDGAGFISASAYGMKSSVRYLKSQEAMTISGQLMSMSSKLSVHALAYFALTIVAVGFIVSVLVLKSNDGNDVDAIDASSSMVLGEGDASNRSVNTSVDSNSGIYSYIANYFKIKDQGGGDILSFEDKYDKFGIYKLSANSELDVYEDATFHKKVNIKNELVIKGDILGRGSLVLTGGAKFLNGVSMNSDLYVEGDVEVNADLAVAGDASISGTVNFSSLSANGALYTGVNGNLTSTPPSSGVLGHWNRVGTTLSQATANDALSLGSGTITTTGTITSGLINGQTITSTANFTGTGTFAGLLTASDGLTLSSGALNLTSTSGALAITGLSASTLTTTSANLTLGTATSGNLYLQSAGNVGIGGTAITTNPSLYISSNGNVGIGTTAPGALLSAGANSEFQVDASGNITGNRIRTSGNTPNSLGGASNAGVILTINTAATNNVGLVIKGSATQAGDLQQWQNSAGTSLVVVDKSGNVGIGTTGPGNLLDLNTAAVGSKGLRIMDGSNLVASLFDVSTTNREGSLSLYHNEVENVKIRASAGANSWILGNVGIGTTSPTYKLEVNGTLGVGSIATFSSLVNISSLSASSGVYTDANKNLTSTVPSSGTVGYWDRTGTTLSPAISGDAITTSGNISTTGSGTGTFAGLLTASNGLTLSSGALNLTSTSGALAITGLSASTLTTTSANLTLGTATSGNLYLQSAGNVGIGGTAITTNPSLYISSNGNVGIGTTAPVQNLHIEGSSADVVGIYVKNTSGGGSFPNFVLGEGGATASGVASWVNSGIFESQASGGIAFGAWAGDIKLYANSNRTANVTIKNGGNVGIGTTAPGAKLDISGGDLKFSTTAKGIYFTDSTGAINPYIRTGGVSGRSLVMANPSTGMNDEDLQFQTGSTIRMVVGSNVQASGYAGGVGIGPDTTPDYFFDVQGEMHANGPVSIGYEGAGTAALAINGNVGIGTTGPGHKLEVSGESATMLIGDVSTGYSALRFVGSFGDDFAYIQAGTSGSDTGANLKISRYGGGSNLANLHFLSNTSYFDGNVGIGTTAPAYKLQVAGTLGVGSTATFSSLVNISSLSASSGVYTDSNKNLTSTVPSSGTVGYWDRTGTTLSPATSGDAITTSGNISTTGSGTGTFAGLLTASNGLTLSSGALNLTSTSGALSVTGLSASSLITTSANLTLGTATSGNLYLQSAGNVGIGGTAITTNPSLYISSNGNVGIGTTGPGEKLEVNGKVKFTSSLTLEGATGGTGLLRIYDSTNGGVVFGSGLDTNLYRHASNTLRTNDSLLVDGNVGIGTTAPSYTLDVNGNARVNNRLYGSGSANILLGTQIELSSAGGSYILANNQFITASTLITRGAISNDTSSAGGTVYVNDDFSVSGNVGIGVTSPSAAFHILGAAPIFRIQNNSGTAVSYGITPNTSGDLELKNIGTSNVFLRALNAGNVAIAESGGNVGIGTTAPGAKLDVNGEIRVRGTGTFSTTSPGLQLWSTSGVTDANSYKIGFDNVGGTKGFIRYNVPNTTDTYGHVFSSGTPGSQVDRMFIGATGNVGIGTTAPSEKLDVVGDIEVSGVGQFGGITGTAYNAFSDSGTATYASSDDDVYIEDILEVGGNAYLTNLYLGGTQVTSTASELNILDGATINTTELNYLDGTTVTNGGIMFGNGTYITQDASNFFWNNTSKRLGIGTTAPNTSLDIFGTSAGLQLSYDSSNYGKLTVGSNGTLTLAGVSGGGSLTQIATFSPSGTTFDVPTSFTSSGDVTIANDLQFSNQTSSYIKSNAPFYIQVGEAFESNDLTLTTYNSGNIILQSQNLWADGTNVGIGTTAPNTKLTVSGNANITGNLGIGNTNPSYGLDLTGTLRTTGVSWLGSSLTGQGLYVHSSGNVGIGTTAPDVKLSLGSSLGHKLALYESGSTKYGLGVQSNLFEFITPSSSSADFTFGQGTSGALTRLMTIKGTGNVGIGTTGPGAKLDVAGDLRSTTGAYFATTSGNVGVGTASPLGKLDVFSSVDDDVTAYIRNTKTGAGNQNATLELRFENNGYINFYNQSGTTQRAAIHSDSANLRFYTGGTTEYLRLSSTGGLSLGSSYVATDPGAGSMIIAGNVGIGTTGPTYKLQVAGTLGVGSTATFSSLVNISSLSASSGVYTDANKNLTSTVPSSGTVGYWDRTGTTLSPATSGDAITTSGNISTTGSGTGTFAGLLTASSNFTLSSGALNLTSTSGALSVTGLSASTLTTTSANLTLGTVTSGNLYLQSAGNVGIGGTAITTNPSLYISSNGNVGIGTTAPVQNLHIEGSSADVVGIYVKNTSGGGSFPNFVLGEGGATASGVASWVNSGIFESQASGGIAFGAWAGDIKLYANSNRTANVTIKNGGNVGIGTTGPGAKLDVSAGAIRLSTNQNFLQGVRTDGVSVNMIGVRSNDYTSITSSGASYGVIITDTSANPLFTVRDSGNVGIGTTAPSAKLDVKGDIFFTNGAEGLISSGNGNRGNVKISFPFIGTSVSGQNRPLAYGNNLYIDSSGNYQKGANDIGGSALVMGGTNAGSGGFTFVSLTDTDNSTVTTIDRMIIDGNGNVGIGTTSPSYKLDIQGTLRSTGAVTFDSTGSFASTLTASNGLTLTTGALSLTSTSGSAALTLSSSTTAFNVNSGIFNIDTTNSRVGVGTTAPYSPFEVHRASGGVPSITSGTQNAVAKVSIGLTSLDFGRLSTPTEFWMQTRHNGATASYPLSINPLGGNVGIGTTTPGYILDVQHASSKVNSKNGYLTNGADYAEYFSTKDTDLAAGEVVCIDTANSNSVIRCKNASDNNVMGIVSTNPAFLGNSSKDKEDNNSWKAVAMLGQIPAKVSNENGQVKIGDSLTSASVPGYVMKANAGDSTVGIALETLDASKLQGTIQVMISRRNKSLTVESVEAKVTERIAQMKIEDEVNSLVAIAVSNLTPRNTLVLDENGMVVMSNDPAKSVNLLAGSNELRTLQNDFESLKAKIEARISGVFEKTYSVVDGISENTIVSYDGQKVVSASSENRDNILGVSTTIDSANKTAKVTTRGKALITVTNENGIVQSGDPITVSSSSNGIGSKAITDGMIIGYALSDAEYNSENQSRVEIAIAPSWYMTKKSDLSLNSDIVDLSGVTSLSDVTISGNSLLYGDLSVIGDSRFTNIYATGELVVGLLRLSSDSNSINVSGGDLNLQDEYGSGDIIAFGGKVVMTNTGNLRVVGELTAKKYNVDTSDVAGASAGKAKILVGTNEVVVETKALTDKSLIFVTAENSDNVFTYEVVSAESNESEKSNETEDLKKLRLFTKDIVDKETTVNWWIVN